MSILDPEVNDWRGVERVIPIIYGILRSHTLIKMYCRIITISNELEESRIKNKGQRRFIW